MKNELLTKKAGLEKEIKVFTDKTEPLTPAESKQLEKLQDDLEAVETEIEALP